METLMGQLMYVDSKTKSHAELPNQSTIVAGYQQK
jgi:hypothetical protein